MSKIELTLTEDHYRQLVNSFSKWEIENLVNLFDQRGIYPKYTYNNYQTLTFDVPDTETEPISPWRTDIENAPRDGTYIYAIIECGNEIIYYLDRSEETRLNSSHVKRSRMPSSA